MLFSPLPIEGPVTGAKRAGIEWDALPYSLEFDSLLPSWAQSLTQPLAYTAPPLPSCIVTNTSSYEFDPLLKLRIRDSILCDRYPTNDFRLPLTPVAGKDASIATVTNDVVRLWNSEEKALVKSVHLPKGYSGPVSAFDADWQANVVALGRKGSVVSVANLDCAVYEKSYQTQQPVVQAISLDTSSLAKTVFTGELSAVATVASFACASRVKQLVTVFVIVQHVYVFWCSGGPALANPGCSVSLWDSRSSSRQLSINLTSACNIYGIRSQGNELYVRDAAGSLAVHDVRMLHASSVSRVPCGVKLESVPEDTWWDIDATFDEFEEKDVEDEFWDCQPADEVKAAGSSYVGSLVMAMGRTFTHKSPSKSPSK